MMSFPLFRAILREHLTPGQVGRQSEPELVMNDSEKVAAYNRAGREDGVMAAVYLYHCAQICNLIRPGDNVYDFGCGPAVQLSMVARLNPESRFIGVDLSSLMLELARRNVDDSKLRNVSFIQDDITKLSSISDSSADVIMSTMALHHLPDVSSLDQFFGQMKRILKPNGAIYCVDFGRLKSYNSMVDMAHQYDGRQSPLFTEDYLYSLHAAFSVENYVQCAERHFHLPNEVFVTKILPIMISFRHPRIEGSMKVEVVKQLKTIKNGLPWHHRRDYQNLACLFRLNGLPSVV